MTDGTSPDATPAAVEAPARKLGLVKAVGILGIIGGILLIVVGIIAWIGVTTQLTAEKITIPDDAIAFQGQQVTGPLTAYVQADIINTHALAASDGKTYAELRPGRPGAQHRDAGVVPAGVAVHLGRRVRRRAVRRRDGRPRHPVRLGVPPPRVGARSS